MEEGTDLIIERDILIVDDTTANLELLENILHNAGYKIRSANNGEMALRSVYAKLPILVLLDIKLTGMDGLEVCRRLKANEKTRPIPVIFISTLDDESGKPKGFQAGAVDFITKPILTEELLVKVKTHAELRKLQLTMENQNVDITRRKLIEEDLKTIERSLQEQKNEFETIFDLVPAQIWYKDTHNRFIRVNRKVCNDIGLNNREIEGRSAEEVFPAFAKQYYKDDLEVIHSRKPKLGINEQINTASGDLRWLHTDKIPVFDENSKVKGLIAFVQDITELRHASDVLQESQVALEEAQKIAQVGSWDYDVATDKTKWSGEMFRIFGRDPLLGEPSWQEHRSSIHPDDWEALDSAVQAAIKEASPYSLEFRIVHSDVTLIWAWTIGKVELDSEGKTVRIYGTVQDVTERKQTEEALQKNKERWESLFNNSPSAIAVYQAVDNGTDFVFTDFNVTAQKTDNIKRDDVVGKRISELFPAAEKFGFLDIFKRVWRTGETEYMNTTNYKDDRIEGWRENIIYKLNTGEIVAIYNDISARMNAEIALRESEQKFRSIFENHAAIKLLIDPDTGNIEDANEAAANYYGWSRDELKQMKIQQINTLPPEQVLDMMQKIKNHIQTHHEFKHRLKGGSIRDVDVFSSKIEIGGKVYLHSINHDITERKQAEEELRESNELNKFLLQTIPFGIDIVDEQGNILFVSDNLEKQIGREAIGKKCWNLYRDDKAQCFDCPLLAGIDIGKTEIYESQGVLGGRTFQISHTGMLFQGKKALLEIFQDITERKLDEIELVKAKEKAEESDHLKTAFLQNISHEIRTPMNAIVGFSGFLNDPELLPEKRKHFVDVIIQSSNQLLSIITDIISIATIEAGQGKIYEMEIELNSTLKLLYSQFIGKAQKQDVSLRFETSLHDNEDRIRTDKTKLEGILTNLIGNALKFTKKGYVNFGYRVKGSHFEFYVEDTGIGIPTKMHDEIFKRFRQVEITATRQYGGTGLGLSISKAYVQLLGGKMWLTSEPGKGSIFYFTIPYKKANPISLSDKFLRKLKLELNGPKTLLIAEDEDSNFMLLEELLSGAAISIIRAVNGIEAVEICKSNPYIDVVLMDIKMPVMDGLEATRQIKTLNPGLPIIAQTAYSLPEEKEMALIAGCAAFLTKPIKANELIKVINQIMSS